MAKRREPDFGLLSRVHELYRTALGDAPQARQWLAQQGVEDVRILERYGVGFAPGTLKNILPGSAAVKKSLRALGLWDGRGFGTEVFIGCVVLPLFDPVGRVVELLGYSTEGGPPRRAGTPGGVFNASAMKVHAEVTLYTDPLRALSTIARGDEASVAVVGDEWTELTETTFRELAPHRVHVEDFRGKKELLGRLKEIGVRTGEEPEEASSEPPIENGFHASFGRRRYVVQAVTQENPRHLRALVRAVGQTPGRFHLDAVDLYSSRDRSTFVREAAIIFGEESTLIEADLGRILTLAEEYLKKRPGSATVEVGEEARREALEFLRNPRLFEEILADIERLGVVGEESNKLAGYLVAVSRKMEDPLSILILSRSAAGKSTIAEAVASLVPPEDVVRLTRLTGQSLFYQKTQSIRHKLLVVEEESGVSDAAYALRILQSAKRLAVQTPQGSHEVEGPVAVIVTTTSSNLNDETRSRFLVVSVDESREQTRRVLEIQRRRETGEAPPREEILRRHHTIQRCLRPLKVINPFAPHLVFPDHRLSTRREHPKYLALIRAVAFLRQYQRKEDKGVIQVEIEDIQVAHKLCDAILGQSLEDLSPPARRLLEEIYSWRLKGRFTRGEVRGRLGWGMGQVYRYLDELVREEWVLDRGGKPKEYELAWDGREGKVLLGLRSLEDLLAFIREIPKDSGKFRPVPK